RVEVPAEIIKLGLVGDRADFAESFRFDVGKSEDDISDLNASVVNVVLHFDATASVAQEASERVTKYGIAQMADVRGFVWIDASVLDDCFGRVGRWRRRRGARGLFMSAAKKCCAIEKYVEVAATRDFHVSDALDRLNRIRDLLSEGARRFL